MADLKVIPTDLTGASPQFTGKATSVEDLATNISTSTSTLIGDLGMLAAFSTLASALENYRTRVATSMECFRTALNDAGNGLLDTADLFVATDTQLAGTFSTLDPSTYAGFDSLTTGMPGSSDTVPPLTPPNSGGSVTGVPGLLSGLTGGSTLLGGSSGLTLGSLVNP